MVALNKHFAPENPHTVEENRVGIIFGESTKSSRANPLSAQEPRLKKAYCYDETASGMFYYGFRYYDPVTGRWPNRDPLLELGHQEVNVANLEGHYFVGSELSEEDELEILIEINRYGFAFNNPFLFIDPNGESPKIAAAGYALNKAWKIAKKFFKKKKKKKGKCKPCSPKKGSKLCEFVPAGSRQRGAHKNSCTPHCKIWTVLQSPYPDCGCFWSKPTTINDCKGCPSGSRSSKPSGRPGGGGPKK
jgi:RHS repeat-associated protein